MNICFVCDEYPPGRHGGIGASTQKLARALVERGNCVRVVGVYRRDYPAPDYEKDHNVRVWRLRRRGHRLDWVGARIQLFRKIRRWIRQGQIDIVDVPDYRGWAAFWPRLNVPVVSRLCGSSSYFADEMSQRPNFASYWLERLSLHRADYWCSKSVYMANRTRELMRLGTNPDAVIYNPVEIPEETSLGSRSANLVVFTGSLVAKKGVVPLFQAWPRVVRSCPEAELELYGKDHRGPNGDSMSTYLCSQLDDVSRSRTHFRGHVARSTVSEVLGRARVAVFPSYAEGFANAPLESMAAGCPTIYTNLGSGPELIEHNRNGLLVDPDHPDQIADAIIRVLADDTFAAHLGPAGRHQVETSFSKEVIATQNAKFYQQCIHDFEVK